MEVKVDKEECRTVGEEDQEEGRREASDTKYKTEGEGDGEGKTDDDEGCVQVTT